MLFVLKPVGMAPDWPEKTTRFDHCANSPKGRGASPARAGAANPGHQ
jgi:hypothetical protein